MFGQRIRKSFSIIIGEDLKIALPMNQMYHSVLFYKIKKVKTC